MADVEFVGPPCHDCGHRHTIEGCVGEPTPSDLWAGVGPPSSCDCDLAVCKHCGRPLAAGGNTHAAGRQRGLGRCDTRDSGLPYGYEAEAIGEPCSIACLGSAPSSTPDNQATT